MISMSNPIKQQLKLWEQDKYLSALDRHFALEMAAIHQLTDNNLLLVICALVSKQLSAKHACLPLNKLDLNNPLAEVSSHCQINLNYQDLLNAIKQLPIVGTTGDNKPLILDGNNLYLKRYYDYEISVAARLLSMAMTEPTAQILETNQLISILNHLYPNQLTQSIDWQKIATTVAFNKQLSIITGGPGTGKTTTVTKLLYLLCVSSKMVIRLVAPTGKAAARLTESIKSSKQNLLRDLQQYADTIDLDVINNIPDEAATIHRLLGVIPNSYQFRHNKDNPLPLDLLIVDEASMVDLPMMYKLLAALPSHAKLILLGDQNQLASVEAGSILADICAGIKDSNGWNMKYSQAFTNMLSQASQYQLTAAITEPYGLGDNLCMLQYSHRFNNDAGIGQLAKAVNDSNLQAIDSVWRQNYQELTWLEHGKQHNGVNHLLHYASEQYRHYLELIHRKDINATAIINRYNQFRILCATRAGEYGVDGVNQHVIQALKNAGLIDTNHEFYAGRPIIIQANDYNLGLFNGDIGIILADREHRLMAHFIMADESVIKILPARLPKHETCFAMTVHKSQGSEFSNVALVLPPAPSQSQWQLLTKELIYTAITRAKTSFTCLGSKKVFNRACTQLTQRDSGLAARLWR